MRIATTVLALFAIAAIGGFALWPGLITAVEEFIGLALLDAFGLEAAREWVTSFASYAAMGALTFIIVFVTVRKLIENR